jgi:hypothetical protein
VARIALLTLEDRQDFVIDDEHAIRELVRRGHSVEEIPWEREADWRSFDGVIIRTTWDYHRKLDAFLPALERIAATGVKLANPLALVKWNAKKTYLRDLEQRGVLIVPTQWGEGLDAAAVRALPAKLGGEGVLKPQVSASADDTFRLGTSISSADAERIAARFQKRGWMAQPYVNSIVSQGELSLFYFSGVYSHAVRKVPRAGDFRVQEEHGGDITNFEPDAALRSAADNVLSALEVTPLQARVDLVTLDDGRWALMELELIEPSLYFRCHPQAPVHFADAVERWLSSGG